MIDSATRGPRFAPLITIALCACTAEPSSFSGDASIDPPSDAGVQTPAPVAAIPRPLRHLTRRELSRTFDALLGRTIVGLMDSVPTDPLDHVYDRVGEAQSISSLHVEGYLRAADMIAAAASSDDLLLQTLMPSCDVSILGPRSRSRTSSIAGVALQGPDPSYLACAAGDLWSGEPLCPEVTDPEEIKLRYGGYVTASQPIAEAGVHRVELAAAAVNWQGLPGGVDVFVDGQSAGTIDLDIARSADARTYRSYALELFLEPGDRQIRFEKNAEPEVYIKSVSVTGPVDVDAERNAPLREACVVSFVNDFVPRAWRRPLTGEEADELRALFADGSSDGPFFDGLRMALGAVLMAPEFLYHVEIGEPTDRAGFFRLTPFELASRLSYLAWEQPPDDELLEAARSGRLSTTAEIRAQAERLFADPRAAETVRVFYEQWLDLHALEYLTKDTALFPEFTADVRAGMLEETRTFLDRMIWREGAGVAELLTAERTWLPPALAPIYGVTGGSTLAEVPLPSERLGLLTQPSFLAIHGHPNRHSPVLRGTFILRRLLCVALPDPPADVDFTGPDRSPAQTTRGRFIDHQTQPRCMGCHSMIDPIGFPFESFDTIGRFRTEENGVDIDATGGGPALGLEADAVGGATELAHAIADSDLSSTCFARQWLRFGLGRRDAASDQSSITALEAALASGGIRAMLVELTTTESFLHRIVDPEEQ